MTFDTKRLAQACRDAADHLILFPWTVTTGAYARDANGRDVAFNSDAQGPACSLCAMGLVTAYLRPDELEETTWVHYASEDVVRGLSVEFMPLVTRIIDANDSGDRRTAAERLRLLADDLLGRA